MHSLWAWIWKPGMYLVNFINYFRCELDLACI